MAKRTTLMEKKSANFAARVEKILDLMTEEGIAVVMIEDTESRRDQNIRWLTGHPSDALLFLSVDGSAVLAAWDINMAKLCCANQPHLTLLPYKDYDCQPRRAAAAIMQKLGVPLGCKIEIPSVTSYPAFLNYVSELTNYDVLCREKSIAAKISNLRAVKDEEEIAITREAACITNELIDLLEKNVRNEKIKTEADAALFIEIESRKRGCEGTSFGTLAAGPQRSFAIHAFPGWTCAPFGGHGLSILDFGVKLHGYCTDVTLTFTRDLEPKQEKLVTLTEKAAKLAVSMAHNGTPAKDIAAAVDAFFARSRKQMPHGLGHGIGLQEHEYPVLKNRGDNDWVLEPGMIFTIEPGLYDPHLGGCRLENDILMTETGTVVLTTSRIIRL